MVLAQGFCEAQCFQEFLSHSLSHGILQFYPTVMGSCYFELVLLQEADKSDVAQYLPPTTTPYDVDGKERAWEIRRYIEQLLSCWDSLESQVEDKDARLKATLGFQQAYYDCMAAISDWLDSVQVKLLHGRATMDVETRLRDHTVIYFFSVIQFIFSSP